MNSSQINNNISTLDREVNLKGILIVLLKQKKLISFFSFFGFFLACIIALFSERLWKGEFQIVLNKESNKSNLFKLSQSNQVFSDIVGNNPFFGNEGANLKTEVEILKSSSVLVDIFEFVKDKKFKGNNSEEFRFKDWRKSLDIKLLKGTSILDISYKDNDRKLIQDVLNKVSLKFQRYAGEKRLKKINLGIKYFEDQINLYSKKSIDSLKKAQKFSEEQDLAVLQDLGQNKDSTSIDIESLRVISANEIRLLNQKIMNLESLQNNDSNIISQALLIPEFRNNNEGNVLNQLIQIEFDLVNKRTIFREEDRKIKRLIRKRDNLLILLKDQLMGVYKAKKLDAQAKLNASKRPSGVLLKYSELLGNSYKDKKILENLDIEYRALLLEKARNLEPWNLITKPTLLPSPVGTSRKLMAALGLLYGFLIGSIIGTIIELKGNTISSTDEIKNLEEFPILDQLSLKNLDYWEQGIELISSSIILNTEGSLGILLVDDTIASAKNKLNNYLSKFLKKREFLLTNNFREILTYDNIIILITINLSKKRTLNDINNKLKMQNKKTFGSIIICDKD